MEQAREFDIIIWGASGFTGKLVAEYLYQKYGANQEVKWAMAGRNQEKLMNVRQEIADESVAIIIADSHDRGSLDTMVQRTKVVCTTVGPYAKYGTELVAACVAHNTHYCDLAGEPPFIRQMIDQHHEAAKANGTKIVHSCGFDSIPSDLGVFFIQQKVKAATGQYATAISMRVKEFAGEFSGGTYASLSNITAMAMQDQAIYKVLTNPYSLNPEGERSGPDQPGLRTVAYDERAQSWMYPFVMENINTKIVRRSHALAGYPYGKDFRYEEASLSGDGEKGQQIAQKVAAQMAAIFAPPGSPAKKAMDEIMPKPGEGPDKAAREAGHYTYQFYITLADGQTTEATVTGDMDPGYGSTSKMLAETAVCLAKDEMPAMTGVITPTTAMGQALLERLEANAGLTFSL